MNHLNLNIYEIFGLEAIQSEFKHFGLGLCYKGHT